MRMKFIDKYIRAGKTIAFFYYLRGFMFGLIPRSILIKLRPYLLRDWEKRNDAEYIRERVDYYKGLPFNGKQVTEDIETYGGPKAVALSDIVLGKIKSRYVYDVASVTRFFPSDLKMNLLPGDIWRNPKVPIVVKARRIAEGADNVTILRMDTAFLYLKPKDHIPFKEKENVLFFRGAIYNKPRREEFFRKWADHPFCDLGDTTSHHISQWHKSTITLPEHFKYRYILCLEGNDISSSLQWVMASNCVPVMPKPTVESWLMESRMIPGVHYIEIASDFSDVDQKMEYYRAHPEEAEKISRESKKWVRQFLNKKRERIIALLVMENYFNT